MAHLLFPNFHEPVTAIQVYRGTNRIQTLDADYSEQQIITRLQETGHAGVFCLKPVTRVGVQAGHDREILVPEEDENEAPTQFIERQLEYAERARQTADAEVRVSLQTQMQAERKQIRAETIAELAEMRSERDHAQAEARRLKIELETERQVQQARLEATRARLEADADGKIARVRLDAEDIEQRGKLALERLRQNLELDAESRVNALKMRLDSTEAERSRVVAELDTARREADKLRAEHRRAMDELQNALTEEKTRRAENEAKLRAQLTAKNSEALTKAHEFTEIAKALSGADADTRDFVKGLVGQEHGITPPSTTDRVLAIVQENPQLQEALWGIFQKAVAPPANDATAQGSPPKRLPERVEIT
jgi:hypothetical protein